MWEWISREEYLSRIKDESERSYSALPNEDGSVMWIESTEGDPNE